MTFKLVKEEFYKHPFSRKLSDLEKDLLIQEFIEFAQKQKTTPFYSKDLPEKFDGLGKDIFCIFLSSNEFATRELMAIEKETNKFTQDIWNLGSVLDFYKKNPNTRLEYQYQLNQNLFN